MDAAAPAWRYEEAAAVAVAEGGPATVVEFVQELVQDGSQVALQDFGAFPRTLGVLAAREGVRAFHAAFTRGVWDSQRWGRAPAPVFPAGGAVEMTLETRGDPAEDAEAFGRALRGLSGRLCGSLQSVGTAQRSEAAEGDGLAVLSSTLPREAACVENLAALRELLPCRGEGAGGGLVGLLGEQAVFGSDFHSLSLHLRQAPLDDGGRRWELAVRVLLGGHAGLALHGALAGGAGPAPARGAFESCGLASSTALRLEVRGRLPDPLAEGAVAAPGEGQLVERELPWQPGGHGTPLLSARSVEDLATALRDAADGGEAARWLGSAESDRGGVSVTSYLTPAGPFAAYLNIHARVQRADAGVLTVRQEFPHFAAPRLESSRASVARGDAEGEAAELRLADLVVSSTPNLSTGGPSRDRWGGLSQGHRGRASSVETTVLFRVPLPPAGGSVSLSIRLALRLLNFQELPPDSSRGLDLPAPVLRIAGVRDPAMPLPACATAGFFAPHLARASRDWAREPACTLLQGQGVLVPLPIPDLSMPFNIITIVCTVLAFFTGAVANLVVRRGQRRRRQRRAA